MTGASQARTTRKLVQGLTARLTGKTRGPDRQVRRDSYDVDDGRANPWVKIGDGSPAQGLAHRDALVQAADELRHQQWKECSLPALREARETRATLAAELQDLVASGRAPIGRPAALRQEITRLDEKIDRADKRLRRVDITVLRALMRHLDFATGKLFPALETIAEVAGCHKNSVIGALRRLKAHGFIDWVRRSVKTDNAGLFAPQRKQTSNAYFFDHRRKMASRTWSRFLQLLVAKMRRFGASPAGLAPPPLAPPSPGVTALRAAIDSLGVSLSHAST